MKYRFVFVALIALILTSCAKKVPKYYTAFFNMQPNSILIVPPMNESVEVSATIYFLSTISMPVAERGYYVYQVNLTKGMLEELGLSDIGLVYSSPPQKLKNLFGCDAVFYITVKKWDTQYLVISSSVIVTLNYTLKDAATGNVLWQDEMTVKKDSGGSGIIEMAVEAAVNAIFTDYVPLARKANLQAVTRKQDGLPAGKYHPNYGKDHAQYPVEPAEN